MAAHHNHWDRVYSDLGNCYYYLIMNDKDLDDRGWFKLVGGQLIEETDRELVAVLHSHRDKAFRLAQVEKVDQEIEED